MSTFRFRLYPHLALLVLFLGLMTAIPRLLPRLSAISPGLQSRTPAAVSSTMSKAASSASRLHDPAKPLFKLDPALFNTDLYERVHAFWFQHQQPPTLTGASDASKRIWFFEPDKQAAAAFDEQCREHFSAAVDSVGPAVLEAVSSGLGSTYSSASELVRSEAEKGNGDDVMARIASSFESEISTSAPEGGTGDGTRSPEEAAHNALALSILLDQVPRNIFRTEQSKIYLHYDVLAVALTRGIVHGSPRLDQVPSVRANPVQRNWMYMPLMHSESLADHELYAELLESMRRDIQDAAATSQGGSGVVDQQAMEWVENTVAFEKRHEVIVRQFGRYPYRNEVCGRTTTEEESKWLAEGGERFSA